MRTTLGVFKPVWCTRALPNPPFQAAPRQVALLGGDHADNHSAVTPHVLGFILFRPAVRVSATC